MPNPTSKLNLVINGVTTQLDIHDANAVDLTNNQTVGGNKEFTGTTTAHDLVPSATDTYNFGSPTAQWNNAYIKSLTINGVVCGDILTHKVSEFVNVTGAQTIGGNKTFSGTIEFTSSPGIARNTNPFLLMTTNNYDKGTAPASDMGAGIRFFCNPNAAVTNKITGGLDVLYYASGYNATGLNARNYDENSNHRNYSVSLRVSNDSTIPIDFVPSVNALINLGSSTTYWKDCYTKAINGINPGALSLPGTSVNVDTTNWVLDGSNVNIFTPASDGWLGIQVTDTVYDQMHYVFVGRTGGGSAYYQQNVLSPINALWDSKYHGCVFIPVIKGQSYYIRCICSTIVATFYPCQGNV